MPQNIKYDCAIYHKNCFDGFTSLVIFMNTYHKSDKITIIPDMPSAKVAPPNIDGKNVIIMDVAYDVDIIQDISNRTKKMTFIDHHISNEDRFKYLKLKPNDEMVYDASKCGATLTWEHFNKKKAPLFVKYVQDNDTGTWKMKFTLDFIAGLEVEYKPLPSLKNIFDLWPKLFNKKEVTRLIKKGTTYNEYKTHLLEQNSRRYSIEGFPSKKLMDSFDYFKENNIKEGQYKVVVYNGNGCPSTSLLGKMFSEKIVCDFAFLWTYRIDKGEYIVSLRNTEDGIDLSRIAKLFGGGGHEHASAFSFKKSDFDVSDLFLNFSLDRTYE